MKTFIIIFTIVIIMTIVSVLFVLIVEPLYIIIHKKIEITVSDARCIFKISYLMSVILFTAIMSFYVINAVEYAHAHTGTVVNKEIIEWDNADYNSYRLTIDTGVSFVPESYKKTISSVYFGGNYTGKKTYDTENKEIFDNYNIGDYFDSKKQNEISELFNVGAIELGHPSILKDEMFFDISLFLWLAFITYLSVVIRGFWYVT